MTATTRPTSAVRARRRRVGALTAVTLLLTLIALAALRAGGLRAGTSAFYARFVLWTAVVCALLGAAALLLALGGVRQRVLAAAAGLVAALALLLPAVLVSQTDASSEANGFGGCGTFLAPTPISSVPGSAAECASALDRQRTKVVVLAVPATTVALLSLAHLAAGARRQDAPA